MLRTALNFVVFSSLFCVAGCSSDGGSPAAHGGATGSSGATGSAGASGSPGGAGSSGAVGAAGAAGGSATAGAGGSAGSAGSGAAGAAGSGTAGSGAAGGSAACALCDDFEGIAPGMPPDPAKWTPTVLADCMSTATKPVIDASQHHSGSQSLKVTGTDNFCNYSMVGNSTAFKAVGNVVYGRYFVRFETALPPGHTAFMIFPDTNIKSLRMGGQNSAFQWNRQSDDATLPSQSPVGIGLSKVPPVAEWTCLEFMIDQTQGLISTWVGDTLIDGLVADATPTADVDMAWGTAYKPALTGINIGWQNYGGGAMNLWFDDFALSATRIHCQ